MTADEFRRAVAIEFEREQAARKLHWATTVVLGYNNIPGRFDGKTFHLDSLLGADSLCATNLARLGLGGVHVIVWSPGTPFWKPDGEGLAGRAKVRFIQAQLQAVNDLGKATAGALRVARTAAEMRRINAEGGIAVLLHLSGVSHLNDMAVLREYYDLGVRMVHCGFQDWPETPPGDRVRYDDPLRRIYHGGRLSAAGARTIEEMKRLGMIVDTAHLLPEGFDDVADRMEGTPFVYSHGACAALSSNDRTFDDARIARLAANGGVYGIGVCHIPDLAGAAVKDPENEARLKRIADGRAQRQREMADRNDLPEFISLRYGDWDHWEEHEVRRTGAFPVKMPLWTVVAHMRHLRDRFGPQVVGYGPDYEFTWQYMRGLEEADKTPNLTRALLDDGFAPEEVQGAMGHNFMRVFEAVLR
jgi:membrane dipeptidase